MGSADTSIDELNRIRKVAQQIKYEFSASLKTNPSAHYHDELRNTTLCCITYTFLDNNACNRAEK